MGNFDYEVLTSEVMPGMTTDEAAELIGAQYPDHHVIVEVDGNEFVATLARKSRVGRRVVAADDDALDLLDDAPPPAKDGPPKDLDEGPEVDEKEAPEDDKPNKEKPKDEKDKGDDKGDDLSKALDALKTLVKVLPKLEGLLGGGDLGLGDDLSGGLDHPGGPPGGHVAPPDEGLGPLDVGPTPGAPPSAAGKPPVGGPPVAPPPPHAPPQKTDMRRKPAVGVPAFSHRRSKVVYRPLVNEDDSGVTMAEATAEISAHPRYAAYNVVEVKRDEASGQYAAYLQLK